MKKLLFVLLIALPALGITQTARTATSATKTPTAAVSNLEAMLSKTGYEFTKADGNIFITKVEGKNLKDILIIATESEGMTILFCIVKEKATAAMTLTQYKQILKLTMEFDKVKIGLDDDESLMARIDMTTRILDVAELTENLDQLGAACDEAFAVISKK
jgi:ribosomal protein L12E/L44/L45/RPP1/RPP2